MARKRYWEATNEEKRADMIASLQALVNYFKANPEVPVPSYQSFWINDCSKEQLEAVAVSKRSKAMGNVRKNITEQSYMLHISIGDLDNLTLNYIAERENVCLRKQVGTRIVPATVEEVIIREAVPEHEEPVYEWECSSLLAPAPEPEAL